MKNIFDLFPILAVFFTNEKDGVSLSEAQRIKESNKNEAEKLALHMETDKLYNTEVTFIGTNGKVEHVVNIDTLEPTEFKECTEKIAELYEESAYYGEAISMMVNKRKDLQSIALSVEFHNGIEAPVYPMPIATPLPPINMDIETFCQIDKATLLLSSLNATGAKLVGGLVRKAIQAEALASVYGKKIHPGSFLRNLAIATEAGKVTRIEKDSYISITEEKLAYKKSSFGPVLVGLEAKYNQLQQERNFLFKQIKDSMRQAVLEWRRDMEAVMRVNIENARLHHEEKAKYDNQIASLKLQLDKELAALKVKPFVRL